MPSENVEPLFLAQLKLPVGSGVHVQKLVSKLQSIGSLGYVIGNEVVEAVVCTLHAYGRTNMSSIALILIMAN